jgi:hypothetical protein
MPDADPILILVRDLIFSSKIIATARATNAPIKCIRDASKLLGEPGQRLIADLNLDGVIPAAIAWKAATGGEVIGFISHVDTALIAAARAGGIDRVMPRSEFVRVLSELLN